MVYCECSSPPISSMAFSMERSLKVARCAPPVAVAATSRRDPSLDRGCAVLPKRPRPSSLYYRSSFARWWGLRSAGLWWKRKRAGRGDFRSGVLRLRLQFGASGGKSDAVDRHVSQLRLTQHFAELCLTAGHRWLRRESSVRGGARAYPQPPAGGR